MSLIALGFLSADAQNTVRIEIDHGGLHCPYLGPRFKDRFTELEAVDSVHVDSKNSIGTLYLSEGHQLSDADITEIIVHKVGYPLPEIKAIIRE